MRFAYLDLPELPEEFFQACVDNTKFIDIDPRLDPINKYRGAMNRATFLPKFVSEWITENIINPNFDPVPDEMRSMLLNVTTYQNLWKRPETWGTHPRHIDIGRDYALNYYFTTGGKNTSVRWYSDQEQVVAETTTIQPNKWILLKVNEMHDVRGIEPGETRYFITLNVPTANIKDFNDINYFKKVLIKETII